MPDPFDPNVPEPTDPKDPEIPPEVTEQINAALAKVKKISFSANPLSVEAFGKTTVSWNVFIPADTVLPVSVRLNGEGVGTNKGSKDFSLQVAKEFNLSARVLSKEKDLGKLKVNVTEPDCQTDVVIGTDVITTLLKGLVVAAFAESPEFKQRKIEGEPDGTRVLFSDRKIDLYMALEYDVPNWFNADVDVNISLEVFKGALDYDAPNDRWINQAVIFQIRNHSVDLIWDWYENIPTPSGVLCREALEIAIQRVADGFLRHVLVVEVLPSIRRAWTNSVIDYLDKKKRDDPQQRLYKPLSIGVNADGLYVKACPVEST